MDTSGIIKLVDEYVKKDREINIEYLKSALEKISQGETKDFIRGIKFAIKLLTEIK